VEETHNWICFLTSDKGFTEIQMRKILQRCDEGRFGQLPRYARQVVQDMFQMIVKRPANDEEQDMWTEFLGRGHGKPLSASRIVELEEMVSSLHESGILI
jgi:hypothetical protein